MKTTHRLSCLALLLSASTVWAAEQPTLGEPIQAADPTSVKGITIGASFGAGQFAPWGGQLVLTDADVMLRSNGKCAFNVMYDLANLQPGATNHTFADEIFQNGHLVSQQTSLSLLGNESKLIHTQAYLDTGDSELRLAVDGAHAVTNDINVGNNVKAIKLRVKANCGSSTQPGTNPNPNGPGTSPTEPAKKSDPTSVKGITIGNAYGMGKSSPWGGHLILTDADVASRSNGQCAFHVMYDLANLQPGATNNNFTDQLYQGADLVSQQTGLSLAGNESQIIHTQAYLKNGANVLRLLVDSGHVVSNDVDTSNNVKAIKLSVDAKCGETSTNPNNPSTEPKDPTGKPKTNEADLTSLKGVTVGPVPGAGKFAPWGGVLNLSSADAFATANGECAFNIMYDLENVGLAPNNNPFANQLLLDGGLVSQQTGLNVAAGASTAIMTQAYLKPGAHTLALDIDGAHAVTNEANVLNNKKALRVVVDAACKPTTPTHPGTTHPGSTAPKVPERQPGLLKLK